MKKRAETEHGIIFSIYSSACPSGSQYSTRTILAPISLLMGLLVARMEVDDFTKAVQVTRAFA
jgi:hypothetical protein